MREKLIELICVPIKVMPNKEDMSPTIRFKMPYAEELADHLIAEGVTIQKWIPVTERLPKPGTRVLVCIGAVFEAFIDDAGIWQRYYFEPLSDILGQPTHWMPLPELPKEVE